MLGTEDAFTRGYQRAGLSQRILTLIHDQESAVRRVLVGNYNKGPIGRPDHCADTVLESSDADGSAAFANDEVFEFAAVTVGHRCNQRRGAVTVGECDLRNLGKVLAKGQVVPRRIGSQTMIIEPH